MKTIGIVGAGITGVTTAYELKRAGYDVIVFDQHRYSAMETSYANGGQLSACNAEVWNSVGTVLKGMRWLFQQDAPLLFNPKPSWHKYSWIAEFLLNIRNYERNTLETVRLAQISKKNLFKIAERESIDFDLEKRGILHIFHDQKSFAKASSVNELLRRGGLDRYPVSSSEISEIEPALARSYVGGFFTPDDASGDIHKFTRGLAKVCAEKGVVFEQNANVKVLRAESEKWRLIAKRLGDLNTEQETDHLVDKVIVCSGVASRSIAGQVGDRANVYPVKGYSITVNLLDYTSQTAAPTVSLLDEEAKIVTSRLGRGRFRVAGTAELNGFNRDIRADRVAPLTAWVRSNFPQVDTSSIVPWAGLRPMMPNMMPIVRRGRRRGIYYNTGHGHLGWTLSAATAEILRNLVDADVHTNSLQ